MKEKHLHGIRCFENFGYEKLIWGVSERVSQKPYGFSMALHTGEEREKILSNRSEFAEKLRRYGVAHFVSLQQCHGDGIAFVDESKTVGWTAQEEAIAGCDAVICSAEATAATVLTADCVPVLLCAPERGIVAAVHAGWRGSAAKIVAKTVSALCERYDIESRDLVALIAPAIGGCCYEVDEAVAKHFVTYPEALVHHGDKYRLDLREVNRQQLLEVGMLEDRIILRGICTACESERFFSYRKEGASGRFLSFVAWRK